MLHDQRCDRRVRPRPDGPTRPGIFIQFVREYTPTGTCFSAERNCVINGGTGAPAGLQVTGNWIADGANFPYFVHTETGPSTGWQVAARHD